MMGRQKDGRVSSFCHLLCCGYANSEDTLIPQFECVQLVLDDQQPPVGSDRFDSLFVARWPTDQDLVHLASIA